jgi:DNA-binding NarL/FixJ family response regulator
MHHIKVALHAPDQLSITGLSYYLDHCPELVATTWTEEGTAADVGLMAVERSVGHTAFARLRAGNRMPVVLVADELPDVEIRAAARYGVVRILPRTALKRDELVDSVLSAATGGPQQSSHTGIDAFEATPASLPVRGPSLQPREADVLKLLADGLETQEIATKLCYSERTVKNIISKVMHRLELRGRTQAVAYAVRAGAI